MRVFAFIIVLLVGAAAVWYVNNPSKPEQVVQRTDLWAGDQESGCMYPISDVSNGKDPVWWSTQYRQWNIFGSKAEARSAGYYECP